MRYCSYCGKELFDDAEFCPYCGRRVNSSNNGKSVMNDKPITGKTLGFILSFFLGVIGLLLAVFLGDEECKSMAIKTFVVCLIISVIIYFIFAGVIASILSSYL